MSPRETWRSEADDEWHATHRSAFFKRRRSRLGEAVSTAELGPFGGAPRRPALRIVDRGYAYVRYAERHFSYTTIQIDLLECHTCGHRLLEQHRLMLRDRAGTDQTVGQVRKCRACDRQAWLFMSHMPTVVAARKRSARVVL